MASSQRLLLVVLLVLALVSANHAAALSWFDIPTSFSKNNTLNAHVDSLRSPRAVTPFNYYRLPVCPPTAERVKTEKEAVNLGEILMGNRVLPSDYNFTIGTDVPCTPLCATVQFTYKDVRRARMFIMESFRGSMFLDHLPLLSVQGNTLAAGHPLGVYQTNSNGGADVVLFNHLDFHIGYMPTTSATESTAPTYNIVSFAATARSVGPECSVLNNASVILPTSMARNTTFDVTYSYSVHWELDTSGEDAVTSRQTHYEGLLSLDPVVARKGHWVTALNSTMMVLLLSVVVLVVIVRTIRRDLVAYLDEGDMNVAEDHSWKLVRGDAFRAPHQCVLFVAAIASGVQVMTIVLLVVLAVLCGILKSSQRGALLSGIIALFLLTSSVAGYTAARMLKFFHKQSWKNGLFATFFCPLVVVSGYLVLNAVNWMKRASLAIPFSYAFSLALLWLFLSMPMGVLGLALGFRQEVVHVSARVSNIPRLIPVEAENRRRTLLQLCAGALPVLASMLEISYMLSAMWQGQTFYMMGALVLIVFNVFLICAEMGVVVTYNSLVRQDYRWWWPSFTSLGSAGGFLFLYTVLYLVRYLEITAFSSIILYLGYMAGLASFFGLMCGTISTVASFVFVNVLYTVVKAD